MEASVFVIAPFGPDGQHVIDTVGSAMQEAGYKVIRQENENDRAEKRTQGARQAIREADLVIADVSNQNPNVMYELGFAHALRKLTIPLISKESTVYPADLAGFDFVFYDPEDFHSAIARLRSLTKSILARRDLRRALTF
jgi:nucleoside 2-deoxyribosyltransferase